MFDFSKVCEMRIGAPTGSRWPQSNIDVVYLDLLNCGVALASMNNDSIPILFGITSILMPNLR